MNLSYKFFKTTFLVCVIAAIGLVSLAGGCTTASVSTSTSSTSTTRSEAFKNSAQDAISVANFDWQDAARDRSVPVRLYMPDAVNTGNKAVPLIVFSHGLGGSRNGYQYLGRFWASQGYASLHVQHVGSDSSLWRGNPLSLTMRLASAAQDAEAMARAKDVSFALTELLAMPSMAGRIDASRVVAAGHSYGANTTMLLAGALVPGKGENGQTLNLRDPRIKAAIIMSAPPFYGFINPGAILGSIALPTLHITATGDDIMVPGYGSGFEDRVNVFNAMGDARKTLVVFTGGSHSIFTDRSNTGGAELNPKVKAATQALSLAFLKQTLGGENNAVADWQPKFADLLARFVPPK